MAESFVSTDQFGGFSKRTDERFDAVNQRFEDMWVHFDKWFDGIEKRFQDLNFRVNQYYDDVTRALSELRVEMRQTRNWLIGTWATFVVGCGLLLLKDFFFN